tara:strand:- start:1295 stop:1636 length:342 start_codon:yes stop_codon:yes gene_type:complete
MSDYSGEQPINLDLSVPPVDLDKAENYTELYGHWKRLSDLQQEGRDLSQSDFAEWEGEVRAMLTPSETQRFEKPLRPHIPISDDTVQFARIFHLTKILWARKGIEKLMKDTGY